MFPCLGQQCQKQPSTNIASFNEGKYRSGRPGSEGGWVWSLYLGTALLTIPRTASSGLVPLPRIVDMTSLRFSGLHISAMTHYQSSDTQPQDTFAAENSRSVVSTVSF